MVRLNEMIISQVIILIVATISAIGGLVLVTLQKKGIIKPVLTQTTNGFDFTSGGTIALFATIVGTYILFGYSKLWAVLYVLLFGGYYILIQILTKDKKK